MERKPLYDISTLYKYRALNKEMPPVLVELSKRLTSIKNPHQTTQGSSKWREEESNKTPNWLVANKLQMTENDKMYASIKSILNKLSADKFASLLNELLALKIKKKDHLCELTSLIYNKAIKESNYCFLYAKLCSRLTSLSSCEGDIKITFKEILIRKCQNTFEEVTNNEKHNFKKDHVVGCVRFIGELYNVGLLPNSRIYICIKELISKIKFPFIVHGVSVLVSVVAKQFYSKDAPKTIEYLNELKKLITDSDISKQEKFIILNAVESVPILKELYHK